MKFAAPLGAGNTPWKWRPLSAQTLRSRLGTRGQNLALAYKKLWFCSIESFMCRSILGVNSLTCTLVIDLVRVKKEHNNEKNLSFCTWVCGNHSAGWVGRRSSLASGMPIFCSSYDTHRWDSGRNRTFWWDLKYDKTVGSTSMTQS